MDDRELMCQVADGDLQALGVLFNRHSRRLHAYFCRHSGSGRYAEDLVQEVFLRVLLYRRSFRPTGSFVAWLYRVARNVAIDHWTRIDRSEQQQTGEDPEPATAAAADPARDADRLLLLRRALEELPGDLRDVLLLQRFGGLRHGEIAEVLDITEGNARVRAHRALRFLADRVGGDGREE